MNQRINIKPALLAFLLPVAAQADLFITNFDTLNAPVSASGVWKNDTTGTDLTIPVSLTQTGGEIRVADGSSQSSTIDDDFLWRDIPDFPPFISGIDSFNPNYDGDYINIEVLGGGTSVVTIHFNAQIVDPVLNFTDVDLQTTMVFTDSFIIDGQSGNIVPSTTSVHPDGTDAGTPFDEECAGSLHFSGTFTQLIFTINNTESVDFFGRSINKAMARAVECSADPKALYDALMGALAQQMLAFDLALQASTENQVDDNVTWLDFTHGITFANAVRHLCETQPALWPQGLLQMACFVGRNAGYLADPTSDENWLVEDPAAFIANSKRALFDHSQFEYIVACHIVKLTYAVGDEVAAAPGAPWVGNITGALNRFLHSPLKRKHVVRTAQQALDFVARED